MRNRNINIPLLILGIFVNMLLFVYFLSAFMPHNRLQEEHVESSFQYSGVASTRSSKVLYLDQSRYRIAIESPKDIYIMEYTKSETQNVLSKEAGAGPADRRPTLPGEGQSVNAYDETEADETIDQNALWESPSKSQSSRSRRTCKDKPINDVVLLKTHCTGGTGFANIFYRYGDLNELNFALPKHRSYEYYWPLHFHPSFVDANYLNRSSPNLLINARYSTDTMKALVKNAFYVTILRNPVDHFESVFRSYHISTLLGMKNYSNPMKEFLSNPWGRVFTYLGHEPGIDINLNMMMNGQFFDLGLGHKLHDEMDAIKKKIVELTESVDLVLIWEYFDESLVLLKRQLCWELDDVLYFRFKPRTKENSRVSDEQQNQIKVWNKADTKLYDYFNNTLWEKIRQQDSTFYDEVHELRRKVHNVEDECVLSKEVNTESDELEPRLRSDIPSANQYFCEKMKMKEEQYITYLKKKIDLKDKEQNQEIRLKFAKKRLKSSLP